MKASLLLVALASPAFSAGLPLPANGWASWQAPAVAGAPAWCCTHQPCALDGDPSGHGMHSDDTTTDAIKVYARVSAGKVDSLQVFAASCPVVAKTPIQEMAGVTPDDSARWLAEHVKQEGADSVTRRALAEGALAALAMHRGELARNSVASFARQDPRAETRKWAVFWLGMVRGSEGESAAVIDEALRRDPDEDVREHAVFVLSRLPGDRATQALIATVEDRSLPRELRKRAMFWLSQSESDAAQSYLEKVLARNAVR